MMTGKLKDKVIFITGASRGIGSEFAKQFAKDGAKVVIAARTDKPHPVMEGTIYTVAKEVEEQGGIAFPIQLDISQEEKIYEAVEKVVSQFGGIDILINNASIIYLTPTVETPAKRFDIMFNVITRGTFLCSQACVPHLKKAANPHILNITPPMNMRVKWFKPHLAYTICKYGASMCTFSMSEEFKPFGIAVNSLWPKATVATVAVALYVPQALPASRKPKIMSDAAYEIVTTDSRQLTGNFFLDEDLLRSKGKKDFTEYASDPTLPLFPDIYVG